MIKENNVKNYLKKIIFVEKDYIYNKTENTLTFFFHNKPILINQILLKEEHNFDNINLILKLLEKLEFSPNLNLIKNTLEHLNPVPGRGNVITIQKNNFSFNITCEYHNSNSLSFEKALNTIKEPTLVIMGFMHSLGENSLQKHKKLLDNIDKNQYIKYIITGDKNIYNLNLSKYKKILTSTLTDYENIDNILFNFLLTMKNNSINHIFVKGSRSSKLELYVKKILDFIETNTSF